VYHETAGDVTLLLRRLANGEKGALDELFILLEEQLRTIARARMAHETPGHTLQPTALVNELYLVLSKAGRLGVRDRGHFFSLAAHIMRNMLVEHIRGKRAAKRGRGLPPVPLDSIVDLEATASDPIDLIWLNTALTELAAVDPLKVKVVECKYFLGMMDTEVAEALGVAEITVRRHWATAKARLRAMLTYGSDKP
jgi:RNA polymerase sigma-70 factor (ECF subfamily)